MQKAFYENETCSICKKPFEAFDMIRADYVRQLKYHVACEPTTNEENDKFNEPAHYHQHDIDTITFLQKGFPPHVCMGFLIGNVVKYAQRAEYKNGEEDFVKMVDYAKRAYDWYKKTHS